MTFIPADLAVIYTVGSPFSQIIIIFNSFTGEIITVPRMLVNVRDCVRLCHPEV